MGQPAQKDLWTYLSTHATVIFLMPQYQGKPTVFTVMPESISSTYFFIGPVFASEPSDSKNGTDVKSVIEWRDTHLAVPRMRDIGLTDAAADIFRALLHRAVIPVTGVETIEIIEAGSPIVDDTPENFVRTIELRMLIRY